MQWTRGKQSETVPRRCSVNMVLFKMSRYLKENTCFGVSFLISRKPRLATFSKRSLQHSYFPVDFMKFLENLFRWTLPVAASEHYNLFWLDNTGTHTEQVSPSSQLFATPATIKSWFCQNLIKYKRIANSNEPEESKRENYVKFLKCI